MRKHNDEIDIEASEKDFSNKQLVALAIMRESRPMLEAIADIASMCGGKDGLDDYDLPSYQYEKARGETGQHKARCRQIATEIDTFLDHLGFWDGESSGMDSVQIEPIGTDAHAESAQTATDKILLRNGLIEEAPTEGAPVDAPTASTAEEKAAAKRERDSAKAQAKIDKKNGKK